MEWIETPESSNLSRIGYDEMNMILTVEYKNDATYNYFEVSKDVFTQMKIAGSKGKFLAERIKGSYRYARA